MKKIVSLFTVLFFLAAILITGCKKEEQAVSPQSPTAKTEQDVKFESFAKSLAKSLNDASNLSTLKSKISETFDGDYDVLYAQLRYNSLKSSSRLVQNIENDLSISAEELLNEVPLLNISVPYISDDANVNTLSASPWVVYVPKNFQEGVTKYLIGFNAQGESKKFDAVTLPNETVVVVGRNERVIAVEKGKKAAVNGDKVADVTGGSYDYYYIQPGGGSGGGSGSDYDPDFSFTATNEYSALYITDMKCPYLSEIEAWVKGAPEIRLKVLFFDGTAKTPTLTEADKYFWKPNTRSDIDNKWWNCDDFRAVKFNDAVYSQWNTIIKLVWYEEDGGSTLKTIDVPVAYKDKDTGVSFSSTFKIPINSQDDEIGQNLISRNYSVSSYIDGTYVKTSFLHYVVKFKKN